jgi:uncharacterized protein (TIRG00374 family)
VKKLFTLLRYLLFLGAGGLLLWLSFRNISLAEVWTKISHADPFWIAFSILLGFIALMLRAARWKQLIEPMGYSPKLSSTYHAVMIGYLANMAVPRLGEITRCGALNKAEKVPFDKLVGTVIVERVSDVIMLFLSVMLVAVLESKLLSGFLLDQIITPVQTKLTQNPLIAVGIVVAGLVGLLGLIYLFRMKNPPVFIQKFLALVRGVLEGLKSIKNLKNKPLFFFYSIAIWTIYLFMTYVCFFAIPATAHLSIGAGLFVTVLGGIGMTAPVQGGIGVYHWLVSQGLMLYGLTQDNGIVFATLVHTTQTLMLIILGFISMVAMILFNRKKEAHGSL